MRKVFLSLFLIIGFLGLYCHNFVFAANANVIGQWLIRDTVPSQYTLHFIQTCVIDGKTQQNSFDYPILPGVGGTAEVSQGGDGTFSGGWDESGMTFRLTGKVINNDVTFKTSESMPFYTGYGNMVLTVTKNYTGKVSGKTISGSFNAAVSYTDSIGPCSWIATGSYSGTFAVDIISILGTYIISGPEPTSSSTTAVFTYLGTSPAGVAGYLYQLDGGAQKSTTQTSVTFTNLSVGKHTFSVAAKDKLGQVDPTPAVYEFTVTGITKPEPTEKSRLGEPKDPQGATKDPINIATGNMFIITPDLTLPGKNLNFSWIRTYNSREDKSGPLGYGWTHSYNLKLILEPSTQNAQIRDEQGREHLFVFNPNNKTYLSQRGDFSTLANIANGYG